jgi:hypothetical protein
VYARLLAARQEADGRWETFDERPPQSYSAFTATAISVRALQLCSQASQRADKEARTARAKQWLLSHEPRCTEERAYQLMGTKWAGADEGTLARIAAELKATQQDDGGWNSIEGRASDAYSTGRALLALHDAGGVPTSDPAWRRGIEYLIRTQAADGTWHVESRLHPPAPVSPPYVDTGHPYRHDQFISSMGESLAVMALAAALGDGKPSPRLLRAAEPAGIEPWAEALLFGSAADLQTLLDSGFDPNSATKSGGDSPHSGDSGYREDEDPARPWSERRRTSEEQIFGAASSGAIYRLERCDEFATRSRSQSALTERTGSAVF